MTPEGLKRPVRPAEQAALFDLPFDWHSEYWGMPEFTMEDVSASRKITVNFVTAEDCLDFQKRLGVKLTALSDSLWWPPQPALKPRSFFWRGSPSNTRWPVYIPSKGRADIATTPKLLTQAGVDYRLVVEPQEQDAYAAAFGADRVLVLPFSNLGQGSIPARNWIWDHAAAAGHDWHWIIDDNVHNFSRTNNNRRLIVDQSSAPLRIVEDFAARYENLAFAGLSSKAFCTDRHEIAPYTLNTRVYSVTLINTALPYRWRGKYNEDTDLCLRALKDGWATVLFKSFLMKKEDTSRGAGVGGMKGGNTDNVYNTGDHRREFAESLKAQHPDCVEVVWKFGRWHHQVDYSRFKRNAIIRRAGVTPTAESNEYGMRLIRMPQADRGAA